MDFVKGCSPIEPAGMQGEVEQPILRLGRNQGGTGSEGSLSLSK